MSKVRDVSTTVRAPYVASAKTASGKRSRTVRPNRNKTRFAHEPEGPRSSRRRGIDSNARAANSAIRPANRTMATRSARSRSCCRVSGSATAAAASSIHSGPSASHSGRARSGFPSAPAVAVNAAITRAPTLSAFAASGASCWAAMRASIREINCLRCSGSCSVLLRASRSSTDAAVSGESTDCGATCADETLDRQSGKTNARARATVRKLQGMRALLL